MHTADLPAILRPDSSTALVRVAGPRGGPSCTRTSNSLASRSGTSANESSGRTTPGPDRDRFWIALWRESEPTSGNLRPHSRHGRVTAHRYAHGWRPPTAG